ncbi:d-aminoacyl-tRNA deacylase [Phtheirospermum japonicum]|uniref:D-aminoacyl-tRNA deacylase n=1 Tax=Phtheirospermum japonicum TaxID=374723 RepID=A0A830C6V5_9LAMI|nr:d-aminoacyl-tRNA deacylase [Phtheirospermum japonicum]
MNLIRLGKAVKVGISSPFFGACKFKGISTAVLQTSQSMVTLVVATTVDPASINPAKALLAMPGWHPGPTLDGGIRSFKNGDNLRLLEQDKFIIEEDDLDLRWEAATGETVAELFFLSRHAAVSNRPALTIHPIGVPHLKDGDVLPQGGRPGWAAPPCPRIGPWLILLKKIAESHNLVPEFEFIGMQITLEATHHGPITTKPTMFIEIVWEGLGLGEGAPVGIWSSTTEKKKVLLGIGGGHYVPRHMDVILKDGIWVGHLLSGYSLPMDDPGKTNAKITADSIEGTWKQAISVAFDATKAAFPGGEIIAHLDHKLDKLRGSFGGGLRDETPLRRERRKRRVNGGATPYVGGSALARARLHVMLGGLLLWPGRTLYHQPTTASHR